MSTIDMVFEGGGAKGMVFVGALSELLKDGKHTLGRLMGTSAGAITAALLAARYSPDEMLAALAEKDASGKSVFEAFLGMPGPFDAATIHASAVRAFLDDLNLPFVPDFVEVRVDEWLATQIAAGGWTRNMFSFVENGGWYSADAFVEWMTRKLNEGTVDGKPRRFGNLTLSQLHDATGLDCTMVASDCTAMRILYLNHLTAPDCPAVWAARMSMSIPLVWQEVTWKEEWGLYRGEKITGTVLVDGGMLSNFPIALFLTTRPEVGDIVGPPKTKNVLGFLIDDTLPIPNPPATPEALSLPVDVTQLRVVKRLERLVSTMTSAHDNMAIAAFGKNIVRLPAKGVGATEFDMPDSVRTALVEGGRSAMKDFLAKQEVLEFAGAGPDFSVAPAAASLADRAAEQILEAQLR